MSLSDGASSTSSSLSRIRCLGLNAPSRKMEAKTVSAQKPTNRTAAEMDTAVSYKTIQYSAKYLNRCKQTLSAQWSTGRCLKLQYVSVHLISLPCCGSAVKRQFSSRITEKCLCFVRSKAGPALLKNSSYAASCRMLSLGRQCQLVACSGGRYIFWQNKASFLTQKGTFSTQLMIVNPGRFTIIRTALFM